MVKYLDTAMGALATPPGFRPVATIQRSKSARIAVEKTVTLDTNALPS